MTQSPPGLAVVCVALVLGLLLSAGPAFSQPHLRFNERLSAKAVDVICRDQSQQEMPADYQQLLAIAIVEGIVDLNGAPYAATIRDTGLQFAAIVWPFALRQGFGEALDFGAPEEPNRGGRIDAFRGVIPYHRCHGRHVPPHHELGHPCPAGNSIHVASQTAGGVWMRSLIFYQAREVVNARPYVMTDQDKVQIFKEKAQECADAQPRLQDINSRNKIDLNALAVCVHTGTSLRLRLARQIVFRGSAVVPSYAAANGELAYGLYNRDGCLLVDHHQVDVYLTGRRVFGADIPRRVTITLWFFSAPGRHIIE